MNSLLAILALVAVAAGSALRPNDASLVATIEGLQDNPLRPPVHTLDEVIAALVATNNWALLDLITNELQAANAGPSATIDTSIVPQKPTAAVTLPLLPVEELSPVTLPLFPIEGPVAVERPLPESASAVSVVDRPLPVAAPAAAPESAPATSPLVTIILNIQKASDVSADSPGATVNSVIRPMPVASAPVAVTLPFPIAVENPSPVASAPAAVTLPFPIAVEDLSPVAPLPIQVAANDPLWRK